MISIIVPVYNVADYLLQCLDSLVNQTYRDIEIICVNDGSTDRSLEILEEYAGRDERVKIISQENQGLSGARNTGVLCAHGEWIMFVDSDDWLEESCCEVLIKNSQNMDLVLFPYVREFSERSLPKCIFEESYRQFDGTNIEWLYARLIAPSGDELKHPDKLDSLSTAWGKLYKASIIRDYKISFVSTREIGTEDLLFNVYYFTWIKTAVYLSETFYHYRKSNVTSLTKLYKPNLAEQWKTLFDLIERWIKPMANRNLMTALSNRRAMSLIGIGLNITFSSHGLWWKRKALFNVLHDDKFMASVKELHLHFFPLHWRLFYFSARHRLTNVVLLLLLIMKKIIER